MYLISATVKIVFISFNLTDRMLILFVDSKVTKILKFTTVFLYLYEKRRIIHTIFIPSVDLFFPLFLCVDNENT